jgi:cell division protease FtsH
VIDEEVERILRERERTTTEMLTKYRRGLDAVAAALLQHETLDGLEVERLVDDAMGFRAGGPRKVTLADGTVETVDEGGKPVPSITPRSITEPGTPA